MAYAAAKDGISHQVGDSVGEVDNPRSLVRYFVGSVDELSFKDEHIPNKNDIRVMPGTRPYYYSQRSSAPTRYKALPPLFVFDVVA